MNDEHAEGIKKSIEDIIGSDTVLKRKKKSEDDVQRERFEKIIQTLEEIEVRSMILGNDLDLDFTKYDNKFLEAIDGVLLMHFGKEACELIFFYLYERMAPDGSFNQLIDEDGKSVPLTSPTDLWHLIKIVQGAGNEGRAKRKS
jgi:hypothetical protein